MKVKLMILGICLTLLSAELGYTVSNSTEKSLSRWAVHDANRPQPPIVTAAERPGQPPSNAIVLFDGRDLSQWVSDKDSGTAKWKVENGYMEIIKNMGNIRTKQSFGDCQLHVEWASPVTVSGIGQGRGNSGVFLMGNYEVQVLDSYNNKTYPDGQAASVYGQSPPLVNVCRPPGQWQSYDIIFHRPIFKDGKVIKQATITLLHNGVLVQDHFEIEGSTAHAKPRYHPHIDKLPIKLQNHGNPVRYRNIWLVELP